MNTAKGSTQAQQAGTSAQGQFNALSGNAANLYSSLAPELENEAANPQGYNPYDLSAMNTAAQQSAGGSTSAATGQGGLLAARTRNAGGGAAAIADSTRRAGQQLGEESVGIQNKNADLKQRQKQEGMSGLEGLYGEQLGAADQALGIVPQAVNANTNAASQQWDWAKFLLDPLMAAGGTAAAGGAFAPGGG